MTRCKLRRLLTALPSLLRRMTKRRAKDITYHKVSSDEASDDEDDSPSSAPPRTESQRHVTYSYSNESENGSHRTSYLSIPISPRKRTRLSIPPDTDGVPTPADTTDDEVDDGHDVEYLYHRIETLAMDPDPVPRRRTAGVSRSSLGSIPKLTLLPRIAHCSSGRTRSRAISMNSCVLRAGATTTVPPVRGARTHCTRKIPRVTAAKTATTALYTARLVRQLNTLNIPCIASRYV